MDSLSVKLIRIVCALLGAAEVKGTLTNLIASSTVSTSAESLSASHDSFKSNDGMLTTEYYKT